MSEFSSRYEVSKLIGSPPGYVGSTEPESWMTTKIRRRPQSLLLLDEIEKAHPAIWNTFLQVFDAGRLTDSQGRVADFRDVVVVLTTNIGAEVFDDAASPGFLPATASAAADTAGVMRELKTWMRPELLNRIDETLVFRPLTPDVVSAIAAARMSETATRIARRGWTLDYDDTLIAYLVARGYNKEYGARPLLRTIDRAVLGPISRLPHGHYRAVVDADVVTFEPVSSAPAADS